MLDYMMRASSASDRVGTKQTFPKVNQTPLLFYNEERWDGSHPLR